MVPECNIEQYNVFVEHLRMLLVIANVKRKNLKLNEHAKEILVPRRSQNAKFIGQLDLGAIVRTLVETEHNAEL